VLCYRSPQSTSILGTWWAAGYNRSCPRGCPHDRHPDVWGPKYQHEDGGGSRHGNYLALSGHHQGQYPEGTQDSTGQYQVQHKYIFMYLFS